MAEQGFPPDIFQMFWTWVKSLTIWHYLGGIGGIVIVFRNFFKSIFVDGFKTACSNLWENLFKKPDSKRRRYVSMDTFMEHTKAQEQVFNTLLQTINQSSEAIRDFTKEMRESTLLERISLKEYKAHVDDKMTELHEKINETNKSVAVIKGTNEAVMGLAQKLIFDKALQK